MRYHQTKADAFRVQLVFLTASDFPKGIEELLLVRFSNADTRVLDTDSNVASIRRIRFDCDTPFLREFQRVPDEVYYDLTQSVRIACDEHRS